MELTNIVTLRAFGNGQKLVEINGREIPHVVGITYKSLSVREGERVVITLDAAQVNEVADGVDLPEHTANPRADRYARQLVTLLKDLEAIQYLIQQTRWYNVFGTIAKLRIAVKSVIERMS